MGGLRSKAAWAGGRPVMTHKNWKKNLLCQIRKSSQTVVLNCHRLLIWLQRGHNFTKKRVHLQFVMAIGQYWIKNKCLLCGTTECSLQFFVTWIFLFYTVYRHEIIYSEIDIGCLRNEELLERYFKPSKKCVKSHWV